MICASPDSNKFQIKDSDMVYSTLNSQTGKYEGEYNVKLNGKCSGFDYKNGGIKEEYVKSTTIGDFLYIYTRAMYVDLSENEDGLLIFNYHKGITKEDDIIANDIDKLDISLIPTYKYIFKKVEGNYILSSVIEVK